MRRLKLRCRLALMQTTTQVDRRGKRPSRSRASWLEEVKNWRRSGQRAEAYARAHGLHPSTLAFWASQLRHELEPKTARKLAGASPAFVPVRVTRRTKRPKVADQPSIEGEFEVALTNGRRVRLAGSFATESLIRLLAAVEGGAPC